MTTILAIETTTELASLALLTGDRSLVRELSGVVTHSQGVLPAVQSLLDEAGMSLQQCDAIAFGCGPGAFTGIRTTCGIVQGLAVGAGLPVVPVVSLQAMAQAAREQTGADEVVCILDARMQEFYWARYRFEAQGWRALVTPVLSVPEGVQTGDADAGVYAAVGSGVSLPAFPAEKICAVYPHAAQVARLGLQAFERGEAGGPEAAEPLYLRNKIALTTQERMQAKASGQAV